MDEWIKIVIQAGIAVVALGLFRAWIEKVNAKLDDLLKSVHKIELDGAKTDGSSNTRFALVETKVSELAERMARQESSTKRLWHAVEDNKEEMK